MREIYDGCMSTENVPTLYEWLGGMPALNRLSTRFYGHVKADDLLAHNFARMSGGHPARVAEFLAEVLGRIRRSMGDIRT